MLSLIPAVVLLLLSPEATATDYCKKDLCHPHKHIGCKNYGDFDETCGSGAVILQFPSSLRAQLLSAINTFRNQVAMGKHPSFRPAARMATLRWHMELAGLAKFALRRCENLEDFCSNTDEFKYVSYIFGSTKWLNHVQTPQAIVEYVVKFWKADIKSCTMSHINAKKPPKDGQCRGYFTQLVQDLAAHVGCALMLRKSPDGSLFQYGLLCQFSRGKIANELVYRGSNNPGSHCYSGTHSTYPGLCSPDEHVNPNALQLGLLD
ncbi:hypothetical protein KR067_001528 [Drosophila pandora]|nr:hypothetical protein KR067_001528 [Drosophila pandora]